MVASGEAHGVSSAPHGGLCVAALLALLSYLLSYLDLCCVLLSRGLSPTW